MKLRRLVAVAPGVFVVAVTLSFTAPASAPSPEIENVAAFARLYGVVRFFYPSDAAAELDWSRFAVHGTSLVRRARDTTELETVLEQLVAPLGPGIEIGANLAAAAAAAGTDAPLVAWRYLGAGLSTSDGTYRVKRTNRAPGPGARELFLEGAPRPGAHADLELGSGLRARVPLALSDVEARPDPARTAGLDALRAALAAVPGPGETPEVDERLADVVTAWSVFRHFYPYWKEAGVDWDSRLRPSLEAARSAGTRVAQHDALRKLVADVRDGHGSVRDTLDKSERGQLAVEITVIEGRLVVTSSAVPSEAPVGAVVTTIDGVPATDRLAQALSLASGTTQWRQVAGTWRFTRGVKGQAIELGIDSETGPRKVTLRYGASPPPANRPAPLAELQPGLWYVDLTRASMPEVREKLDTLAAARGVIFDVRGYPTDAGAGILPHLLDSAESDRWMHVAEIVGPFFDVAGWQSFGWDMRPASPRIKGRVVFLTDGAAISYAESVMGYVADREMGTIVGGTTAGTNGNVASFTTPSGFMVRFTGMRVTRHDGHSPHHLVGVEPDVAVAPTLAGIRAGRDEVLERGLSLVATDP